MSFNFDAHYEKLKEGDVILSYLGSITTDMINQTLEDIENELDLANESGKVKKKIYNVLVESLQNLYHHIDDIPEEIREKYNSKIGMLIVKKSDGGYLITTGNFINSNKIKFLKDKIDKINSLTQEELKDMYKFILNHQKLSAKGGGGLGLVDIARKTGNKLEYSFQNYNNDYYFFELNVFVSN
ncbi:MAG: SiaB family protein kinase [Bacteroidota bacterium]